MNRASDSGLLADRAYLVLRERIVTLVLAPGASLREDELMDQLAVGRTPLREAVRRLALEGLVSVRPRRGTYVTGVEAADVVRLTEARAELESFAAELAAGRVGPESRERAAVLLAALAATPPQAGAAVALMALDEQIHRWVWAGADNPYLLDSLERCFSLSLRVWNLTLVRAAGVEHVVHDLAGVIEAILAGDGARARSGMREHVLAFRREIVATLS